MSKDAADVFHLSNCLTAHAWNADRSKVAICPNTTEVHIFGKSGATWNLEHVLAEHDQVVTSIDWAPKTNRIVTSSQDRNAYVWNFENDGWKPTLVILRINRAATHVRWSPEEDKFAVASGAKCVSVCYFDPEPNWWVSKHIKKHKSTVLKVDWHPNNQLLATGSSDFKARVFSAYIKGVDKKPPSGPFGNKLPFGELLLELDAAGWVHAIKWAPSGNHLTFAGHDSTINFANVSSQPPSIQRLRLHSLPLRDIVYLSEHSLVGVGEDANPVLFTSTDAGDWSYGAELDKAGPTAAAAGPSSAMNAFKSKVDLGQESSSVDTKLYTKHQNCVTVLNAYASAGGVVTEVSSSGLDGNLIVWHLKTIEAGLKGLKIR